MLNLLPIIAFLACFGISIIYLLPQILFQQPNILDVVETWSYGKDIMWISKTVGLFDIERFRPLFVFLRSVMNVLFSYNPPLYFIFFALLLAVTIYTGFLILKKKRVDLPIYILISGIFFLSPVTIDTYWRLGTAENLFVLVLCICIYALRRGLFGLLSVCLFILMGTKENSLFVVPIFIFLMLYKKHIREALFVSIGLFMLTAKVYLLVQYATKYSEHYTALFSSTPSSIVDMFYYYSTGYFFYTLIFLFVVIHFFYRILLRNRTFFTHRRELGYVYLFLILAQFTSLLFFRNKQQYYYFPVMTTLLLFLGEELSHTTMRTKRAFLLCTLILFILLHVPQQTWERVEFWQSEYAGDGALFSYMQKTADSQTYYFESAYRPEISVVMNTWNEVHPLQRVPKAIYGILLINEEQRTSGHKLCGQTFFGKTVCKWQVVPLQN